MAVTQVGIGQQLVKELRAQVTLLEADLLARSTDVAEFADTLNAEYDGAQAAERTAAGFTQWRGGRITQAAAAWVLGTVFVRFCEDNGLIEWPFIAGPGERLADAEDRHGKFFVENPTLNDRDWLIAAFRHLSDAHPTAAGLFDERHNPLWELTPSFEAATALIKFWRRSDDAGHIRHDLTGLDTRFLGDLYQDLSEAARKTYALLQTPEFVEEFILDLTLEPAVEEFGLRGLRTIDPAAGSGHFLLGIFHRLLAKWRAAEPGTGEWELIRRSLESVHGCDRNPFATSIARFRLLVAALAAGGERRLDRAPEFPINVAVGDSLIHGRGAPGVQDGLFDDGRAHTYSHEDVYEFGGDLLGRASYHVVVGNPPYITVKDRLENQAYRDRYGSCSGKYALSVPFAERMFQLAIRTSGSDRAAGLVGQITANSFMKREFGKKLIERFFPTVQLTHVIDTSGAYIPGHGTPTVILVGRNHIGRADDPIRAVLGVRGEPSQPAEPAKGSVWTAITEQVGQPGSESEWVSVEDAGRASFGAHPWSVGGGGAGDLQAAIEQASVARLDDRLDSAGIVSVTGEDDLFLLPRNGAAARLRVVATRPMIIGDVVRDFVATPDLDAIWVYSDEFATLPTTAIGSSIELLTGYRAAISHRHRFGKPMLERGMSWHEWQELYPRKLRTPLSITFAEVATHNHFVLDRGGRVFKQTAPVIKLPAGASEDDHLALLGVLNSSAACFWLKQACFPKGGSGMGRGIQPEDWMERFAFNSSNVERFPLPADLPLDLGRELDRLAQLLAAQEPAAVSERATPTPTRASLDTARTEHTNLRRKMITLQEELDWEVYGSYGLLSGTEVAATTSKNGTAEPLSLGERAFEIVLARRQAAGEVETAWFARHGSIPITEIPGHWSEAYQEVVQRRIDVIESRRDIALIERPECKRRWTSATWEKKEAEALQTWLLDRCEHPDLWFALRDGMRQPRPLTVNQLADQFGPHDAVHDVAHLYAADHLGKRDLTLAKVLESVVADEHVPYLAALRYKDSGLATRQEWERTWELQRDEDRTGANLHIAVPPKYKPADFRKVSYWSRRGKLDVPKERFVSYPGASPDADPTPLLGWAGWDHKDQAQALVNLVNDRTGQAGWNTDRVQPLLAGLAELLPWVHQWHGEFDAEWDGNPAEEYQTYLDAECARRGLTHDDLRGWRPAPATRGRPRA